MTAPLFWLSAGGGVGTTTLRRCLGWGTEIASLRGASDGSIVVVVARTNAHSLHRAQQIASVHAANSAGRLLAGLVLVADTPGKLPKPLEDLAKLVTGGYTDSWRIPWVEAWRLGATADLDTAPRIVRDLREQLLFVCNERPSLASLAFGHDAPDLRRHPVAANSSNH